MRKFTIIYLVILMLITIAGCNKGDNTGGDINSLIKNLGSENKDTVSQAESKIIDMGDEAVPELIKALENENEKIRAKSAQILGDLSSTECVKPLIKVLETDKSTEVKVNAITALANIPTKESTEPLMKALEDKSPEVRGDAAAALGLLKVDKATDSLIKLLEDKDSSVRAKAALALGKIGDKKAVLPLIKIIKDKDETVRKNTVEALGLLKDEKAVEPLMEALKDKNNDVRAKAALALGNTGDIKAVDPLLKISQDLNENTEVRVEAICALGSLENKETLPTLVALLEDGEEDIRGWAADSIGKIRAVKAIEQLIAAQKKEASSAVKEKINGSIEKLAKEEDALPELFNLLTSKEDEVRLKAVELIGKTENPEAIEELEKALKKEKNDVIKEKIQATLDMLKEKEGKKPE